MELSTGLAIGAVALACLNFAYLQFAVIAGVKERLSSVETKVELFWGAIESKVVDMLKSPTNQRKDGLLDKLRDHTINMDEAMELSRILDDEVYGRKDSVKELASCLALGRLQQLICDLAKGKKIKVEK